MSTNTRVERLINVGISTKQIEKVSNEFPQRQPDLDLKKLRQYIHRDKY